MITSDYDKTLLIGKKMGDHLIVATRKEKFYWFVIFDNGLEFAFQNSHKIPAVMSYLDGGKSPGWEDGHTAFVIGNGPSLMYTPLEELAGQRTYACNRIWKLWEDYQPGLKWRPTDYVRLEKGSAREDVQKMENVGCTLHVQRGMSSVHSPFPVKFFACCNSKEHKWHLPMVCGYGTVVHAAMQIAVREGAGRIVLLGCDLGMPSHFYGKEGIDNDSLAARAHEIAKECCPIPIYNASIGGKMKLYPHRKLDKFL